MLQTVFVDSDDSDLSHWENEEQRSMQSKFDFR